MTNSKVGKITLNGNDKNYLRNNRMAHRIRVFHGLRYIYTNLD